MKLGRERVDLLTIADPTRHLTVELGGLTDERLGVLIGACKALLVEREQRRYLDDSVTAGAPK